MSAWDRTALSRRRFLQGGGAATAAVLLGACGTEETGTAASSTTAATSDLALAQFFGGAMFVPGQESRFPFGVADRDGLLPAKQTPPSLTVQIVDPSGDPVGDPVEVARRGEGLPRPYFPLLATLDAPGIYTARTEIDGAAVEMALKIDAAADVKVIQPGAAMPALETPTTADARGVTPICTRDPVCPLHDVTVAEALKEGRPLALLVATPAFCQFAICGPVLDVLLDVGAGHPDIRLLHAEVYADPNKDLDTHAPVVSPLGLHFEPCLVLVGPDGAVADRVDTIYDRSELDERLARLA